jgi:hypothetical protein
MCLFQDTLSMGVAALMRPTAEGDRSLSLKGVLP